MIESEIAFGPTQVLISLGQFLFFLKRIAESTDISFRALNNNPCPYGHLLVRSQRIERLPTPAWLGKMRHKMRHKLQPKAILPKAPS
jgi:hypothetical protein